MLLRCKFSKGIGYIEPQPVPIFGVGTLGTIGKL